MIHKDFQQFAHINYVFSVQDAPRFIECINGLQKVTLATFLLLFWRKVVIKLLDLEN